MIASNESVADDTAHEAPEVPFPHFQMNAEGELQLTEELAEALRRRELV